MIRRVWGRCSPMIPCETVVNYVPVWTTSDLIASDVPSYTLLMGAKENGEAITTIIIIIYNYYMIWGGEDGLQYFLFLVISYEYQVQWRRVSNIPLPFRQSVLNPPMSDYSMHRSEATTWSLVPHRSTWIFIGVCAQARIMREHMARKRHAPALRRAGQVFVVLKMHVYGRVYWGIIMAHLNIAVECIREAVRHWILSFLCIKSWNTTKIIWGGGVPY